MPIPTWTGPACTSAKRSSSHTRQGSSCPETHSSQIEKWIPGHLPEEVIGIGEIAGVAAPENVLSGLDEFGSRLHGKGKNFVHFLFRLNIVRDGEAVESASFR